MDKVVHVETNIPVVRNAGKKKCVLVNAENPSPGLAGTMRRVDVQYVYLSSRRQGECVYFVGRAGRSINKIDNK